MNNEPFKAWGDGWAAWQQSLAKSMFPMAAPAVEGAAGSPLEAQFAELRDTWKASLEKWTEFAAREGAPGGAAMTPEALRELFAPAQWSGAGAGAFDATLRQVLEGPKFATLWDMDRKLLELGRLAQQRDQDIAAYQAVVQKAWGQAFERFTKSLQDDGKAARPETWRGLADRWLAVANDTLIEVYRSDEFIEAQRRMLRSASDYRLQERRIAEAYCEANHIPTRTEMDETQRELAELRRQVRALKREAGRASKAPEKAS